MSAAPRPPAHQGALGVGPHGESAGASRRIPAAPQALHHFYTLSTKYSQHTHFLFYVVVVFTLLSTLFMMS